MSKNYTYEYNPATKQTTKKDVETGQEWTFFSRARQGKASFAARNGMTVQKLQEAGHSVRVKHLRWALYLGQSELIKNRMVGHRMIVVPSTFRRDPMYVMLPKGGFTHVVIKSPSGKYICVSSECSEEDPFCYSQGVAAALDRLTKLDMSLLGV